jgi:hypothetical protein
MSVHVQSSITGSYLVLILFGQPTVNVFLSFAVQSGSQQQFMSQALAVRSHSQGVYDGLRSVTLSGGVGKSIKCKSYSAI